MNQYTTDCLIKIALKAMSNYHNPVLLYASVDNLITDPDGVYVDATFGGGGHSKYILEKLSQKGKVIAFDQDPESEKNSINDARFSFIPHNFCHLKKILHYHKYKSVTGILADLGVSSYQFDTADRGFSFRFDGLLDMRMNNRKGITAEFIVNNYSLEQLSNIFYKYGELPMGKKIASTIVAARAVVPFKTTCQLSECLLPLFPKNKSNKFLAQIFQSLRIEVNDEISSLKSLLIQSEEMLCHEGRLSIISYHSLEDRFVKLFMKSGNFEGEIKKDFYGNLLNPFKMLQNKAITPDKIEIESNSRARSAKLRVAIKK